MQLLRMAAGEASMVFEVLARSPRRWVLRAYLASLTVLVVLHVAEVGPTTAVYLAFFVLCFPLSTVAIIALLVTSTLVFRFDPGRGDLVVAAWAFVVFMSAVLVQTWALATVLARTDAQRQAAP